MLTSKSAPAKTTRVQQGEGRGGVPPETHDRRPRPKADRQPAAGSTATSHVADLEVLVFELCSFVMLFASEAALESASYSDVRQAYKALLRKYHHAKAPLDVGEDMDLGESSEETDALPF